MLTASRCRAGANIVIHIHRRNRARLWVKFASVRRMVTAHPTPVIGTIYIVQRIYILSHSSLDDNKQISVELTVHESGTHGPQMSRTVADVAVARQAVEKKISIVEKLKPILRVLEVLAKISEPLKDVSCRVLVLCHRLISLSPIDQPGHWIRCRRRQRFT